MVLELDRRGGAALIALNRPDAGNAIDLELARALAETALVCDEDPSIRCVGVIGRGGMFCAGGDVKSFDEAGDGASKLIKEITANLHLALSRLARMRKPLITIVNGPTAGAGIGLAAIGDLVFAGRSAHFTLAYTKVGLSPDGGATWLLPRLIGLRRTQELLFTDRRVGADEAEAIGLVTKAVDDEKLMDEAATAMDRLQAGPVGSIGECRRLLIEAADRSFETHLQDEANSIARRAASEEGREGLRAFVERRVPDFGGKTAA